MRVCPLPSKMGLVCKAPNRGAAGTAQNCLSKRSRSRTFCPRLGFSCRYLQHLQFVVKCDSSDKVSGLREGEILAADVLDSESELMGFSVAASIAAMTAQELRDLMVRASGLEETFLEVTGAASSGTEARREEV